MAAPVRTELSNFVAKYTINSNCHDLEKSFSIMGFTIDCEYMDIWNFFSHFEPKMTIYLLEYYPHGCVVYIGGIITSRSLVIIFLFFYFLRILNEFLTEYYEKINILRIKY